MIDNEIRLLAVERFKTLNIDEDIEFQELIHIASETCNTPIAMLTLIDRDTQWLKVRQGTDVTEIPRDHTFCTYTIQEDAVLVVPDASQDERFAHYPTVANDPNVRFYAGAPLITSDGQRVGSLCVIHVQPQELTKQQQLMLKMLSKQAINIMEYRISVELLEKNTLEVEIQKEIIKKAEIRIIDQNKSLLKIAHMQAHEFRAPLTTVIGLLELIKDDDYDVSREYCEMFRNAAENLDLKIHEIVSNVDQLALLNKTEVHSA